MNAIIVVRIIYCFAEMCWFRNNLPMINLVSIIPFFKNREQGFPATEKTTTPTPQPLATSASPSTPITGSAIYTVNVNGQVFSVQVSAGGAPQQVLSAPVTAAPTAADNVGFVILDK